ncbi:expressed unknown protein [Seminavis robusta]|uniref:MYND-type domain-containing protein n=1 Tax=Seminavis robusta TaxID=568900 RepID=A0A9N8D9J8_9STRA|nr:expressed unknown protein [Seminavis robusta]|eukprot:Sro5_g004190.1 n/a (464) ;mRNA; r:79685-81076
MSDMMMQLLGVEMPDGVPPALAVGIANGGHTETEARQMIVQGGDAANADRWIERMRQAGFFGSTNSVSSDEPRLQSLSAKGSGVTPMDESAGSFLWKCLLQRLRQDEHGFKHQVMVLDNCVKNSGGRWSNNDLKSLQHKKAGDFIPFFAVGDNCPWNGCKFVASIVMHMLSPPTASAKCNACRTANRSIGGCTLPRDLTETRWPYSLSDAYHKATENVDTQETALFVNVTDVEIMNNPGKGSGWLPRSRPGTFAHVFVMTIAKDGVHLYQAYGPRGYTLMQYMETHNGTFPLSLAAGKEWVTRFEVFAASLCGKWTEECNQAYAFCFDVDLIKLGCMKIGSQMDVYVKVEEVPFDTATIQTNFNLLPRPDFPKYPPCDDSTMAKALHAPRGYIPDGGVPHRYVPTVLRCGKCGKKAPTAKKHNRCAGCKKVFYCSRDCQVTDWAQRHKKVCKLMNRSPPLGPA